MELVREINNIYPVSRKRFWKQSLTSILLQGFFIYRKMKYIRNCKNCNQDFGTNYRKIEYCCKDCKIEFNIKSKSQLICKHCNGKFLTKRLNQLYCSKKCRKECVPAELKEKYSGTGNLKGFNIFERDNFRCAYCGKTSYEDGAKLVVEHIFPRSKGGTNDGHNIITACNDCNAKKGNKVIDWNIILTLWQVVDERNKKKNVCWDKIKPEYDKLYKTT